MTKINTGVLVAILTVGLSAARGQDAASDLKALDAKLTEAFKTRDYQMLGKHLADTEKERLRGSWESCRGQGPRRCTPVPFSFDRQPRWARTCSMLTCWRSAA